MRRAASVAALLTLASASCRGEDRKLAETHELLKLGLEDLMKVRVTTVSRDESTVGRSPAAVFVIDQEQIRRSGATAFPELFRMVPGMSVASVDGNKWAVASRGFNNRFAKNLLVQVDGRTVYAPLTAGVFWDTVDFPLADIERIEVIRGSRDERRPGEASVAREQGRRPLPARPLHLFLPRESASRAHGLRLARLVHDLHAAAPQQHAATGAHAAE
jgi:outer membrane cobalamin receptor